jgi:hypothetical protein
MTFFWVLIFFERFKVREKGGMGEERIDPNNKQHQMSVQKFVAQSPVRMGK